jgi:hypothetical protein
VMQCRRGFARPRRVSPSISMETPFSPDYPENWTRKRRILHSCCQHLMRLAPIHVWRWLCRPEAALFVLMLGTYSYFYQAGGWNQNSRFDLTRAIVEQRTSILDSYAYNTGDLSCRGPLDRCVQAQGESGEHYYCDKAPGASWVAIPAYAIVYAMFGTDRPSQRYLAMSAWWVTIIAVGVPSAIAVVMLYLMLEAFTGSEPVRMTLALAYGLATLAFPYSTLLYGHQLTAALLVIGFTLLVRAKRLSASSPRTSLLVTVGLVLGYAVVVEYPSAIALIPLIGYAATFVRPWRRLGWLVAGGIVIAIPLVVYHWLVFGGPFALPYMYSTQLPRHIGFMGLGRLSPDVLQEILVSEYRGLWYSAPWLLLAIPGAIALLGRRGRRTEALVCVVISTLFVWLNSSLFDWQGGWAMGPRYLIPAIPFLAVLVVGVVPHSCLRRSGSRMAAVVGGTLALALVVASAILMLAGTAVKPEVPMDIQRPFTDYLLPSLYRGKLSISTQSIDSKWPVGGERQAWNVGQLAGLDGLMSLAPLGLYIAATGTWLAWTARRYAEAHVARGCMGRRDCTRSQARR